MNNFTSTTSFFKELPLSFWKSQYQFAEKCLEIGTPLLDKMAEEARETGYWAETNKAHGFLKFWDEKRLEAKRMIQKSKSEELDAS